MLSLAIGSGNVELVNHLIEKHINVEIRDQEGNSPLMMAAFAGNIALAKILIQANANVDADNKNGETVLMKAVEGGSGKMVQLLLGAGADPTVEEYEYGSTPLVLAICQNSEVVVQSLVATGKGLDLCDQDGNAPLIHSVLAKNTVACDALMDAGVDLNIQDKRGNTALILAVKSRQIKTVEKLISKGADLNIQNKAGTNALMYAVILRNVQMVKMLLEAGARLDLEDQEGYTVWRELQMKQDLELLEVVEKYMTEEQLADERTQLEEHVGCLVLGVDAWRDGEKDISGVSGFELIHQRMGESFENMCDSLPEHLSLIDDMQEDLVEFNEVLKKRICRNSQYYSKRMCSKNTR